MTSPHTLDTPRLRLRSWRADDRAPFAALNADPKVMEFFPAPLSRAASDAMVDACNTLIAERGWGFWAADIKASGQFIGFVGLNVPTTELPFSPCVEIGWRLVANAWGQGFATEAATAALAFAFETLELPEVVSFTALSNLRSQAVMERLGMQRAAQTFEHPKLAIGHALREHCLYRLSREQWALRQSDAG